MTVVFAAAMVWSAVVDTERLRAQAGAPVRAPLSAELRLWAATLMLALTVF